jgi:hypothetical protein
MDNPQPSPKVTLDYGCSSQTKWQWGNKALSYSRSALRRVQREKVVRIGVTVVVLIDLSSLEAEYIISLESTC